MYGSIPPLHIGSLSIPFQLVELTAIVLLALFVQTIFPLVFSYHFTANSFQCRFVGLIPLFILKFDDIKFVRRYNPRPIDMLTSLFVTHTVRNRLFGPLLSIEKKRGIRRNILITPPDADRYGELFRAKGVPTEDTLRVLPRENR
jgi:hypothetical protein